jgi:hypothetical protein
MQAKTPAASKKLFHIPDLSAPHRVATSEVAKPDEIPTAPDDLGIGIDDTNPQ